MKKLILSDFHAFHGAQFMALDRWAIPERYEEPATEIERTLNNLALFDQSYFGKIRLSGSDAADLLDRITTNDMSKLFAGTACDTVFSTPRGKLVDFCRVVNLGDSFLLISGHPDSNHLKEWINRFITIEDVDVKDATDEFVWLTLMGPQSVSLLEKLSNSTLTQSDEVVWLTHTGSTFPVFKNDNYQISAYNICLTTENSHSTVEWLLDAVKGFSGGMAGYAAFEVIRIDSGIPQWNSELTSEYNPFEAGLTHVLSFTKCAYTGQEVISWIDAADRVQRHLMVLELKERPVSKPPLPVLFNEDPIGKITSYTYDPLHKKHLALGYIRRPFTVDGLNLQVEVDLGSRRIQGGLKPPPVKH